MSRSTLDRRCSVHFLANDGACEAPTVSERRLPIMNVSYKPSFTTPPPGSTGGGKEEEDDEGVERVAAPSPESLLLWLQRAGLATTAPARPVGPQYRVRRRTAPSERLRDDSTVMHISSAIDGRCLIVSNRRRVNSRSKKVLVSIFSLGHTKTCQSLHTRVRSRWKSPTAMGDGGIQRLAAGCLPPDWPGKYRRVGMVRVTSA